MTPIVIITVFLILVPLPESASINY